MLSIGGQWWDTQSGSQKRGLNLVHTKAFVNAWPLIYNGMIAHTTVLFLMMLLKN